MASNYIASLIKNIKVNFIRTLLISMISFLASIMYARILGPEKFGGLSYSIWLTGLLTSIFALGVNGTITKFMPSYYYNNYQKESNNFFRIIGITFLITTTILIVLLLLTLSSWSDVVNLNIENKKVVLIISVIAVFPNLMLTIYVSFIQSIKSFAFYAKVNVWAQLIQVAVSLLVAYLLGEIILIILVSLVSNFIQLLIYFIFLKKKLDIGIKNDQLNIASLEYKRIIKYSFLMYINIIWQQIVWAKSELFFLGMYSSAKEISIYNLAFSLNTTINVIFLPIVTVIVNYFSELTSKNNNQQLLQKILYISTKYSALFLIPIFFTAINIYKPILLLIYSEQYRDVLTIFPILFASTIFSVILSFGNSIPFLYEKQKLIILYGIIIGIINILLDFLLVPQYGAVGASYANSISQILFTVVAVIFNIKVFGLRYPIKVILKSLSISLVLLFSIFYVDNYLLKLVFNLVFIVIYLLLVFKLNLIKKNEIKEFLLVMRNRR